MGPIGGELWPMGKPMGVRVGSHVGVKILVIGIKPVKLPGYVTGNSQSNWERNPNREKLSTIKPGEARRRRLFLMKKLVFSFSAVPQALFW